MNRKKVVLTGAAGRIAGLMLPGLRERYDLLPLDVRRTDRNGNKVEGVVTADLLKPDRDAYREHFRGADAVVHSTLYRSAEPQEKYWAERNNLDIAHNVYRICLEEKVARVVMISSCRASYFYERYIQQGELDLVTPDMNARAESFYGWAKQAIEHMGFVFAAGRMGEPPLENVHIRIGAPRETDLQQCEKGDLWCVRRALATYLSARDLVQLVSKSIEADDIRDEFGVPFQVFFGVSGNTHRFWSIANARRVVGYEPQDDSQIRFADQLLDHLRAAQKTGARGHEEDTE